MSMAHDPGNSDAALATAEQPSSPAAHRERAQVLLAAGRLNEALSDSAAALAMEDPSGPWLKACSLFAQKDDIEAISQLRSALFTVPLDDPLHSQMSLAKTRAERRMEALRIHFAQPECDAHLDVEAYSHILDSILCYLPLKTLLACRALCRGMKDLIDGQYPYYITAKGINASPDNIKFSVRPSYLVPSGQAYTPQQVGEELAPLLSRAKVLVMKGVVMHDDYWAEMPDPDLSVAIWNQQAELFKLSAARTIRFWPSWNRKRMFVEWTHGWRPVDMTSSPAKTVVVMTVITSGDLALRLPAGCTKFVLNVRLGRATSSHPGTFRAFAHTGSLPHFVLIIPDGTKVASFYWLQYIAWALLDFAFSVEVERAPKVTVVGFGRATVEYEADDQDDDDQDDDDQDDEVQVGAAEASAHAKLKLIEEIHTVFTSTGGRDFGVDAQPLQFGAAELLERLSFLTTDEYKDMLDEGEWEEETSSRAVVVDARPLYRA